MARGLFGEKLGSDLVKEFDAFRDFWQRILPVVLVLNGEDRLDALAFDFPKQRRHIRFARSPGDIVRPFSVIIEVFEVEGNDPSFKLLDCFQRIDS